MPSTIQHNIVRNSAISGFPWETATIAVISFDARPVDVIHPATSPAIAQATATVIVPRQPASSASTSFFSVIRLFRFRAPTAIAAKIATDAENCIVNVFVDTSTTSTINGASR